MAQHIEIRNEKAPKILQKIGVSIEKTAKAGGIGLGSLRWERLPDQNGCKVWVTTRYIGKGIVWGDTKGCFEVHLKGREVVHIYLVA